jgi:hypothetical protein
MNLRNKFVKGWSWTFEKFILGDLFFNPAFEHPSPPQPDRWFDENSATWVDQSGNNWMTGEEQ